jgi:hypothetical protein
MKAPEPWFYRKRIFLSVVFWPANLKGMLWFLGVSVATLVAAQFWWPSMLIGIPILVIVALAKSSEVPSHWA